MTPASERLHRNLILLAVKAIEEYDRYAATLLPSQEKTVHAMIIRTLKGLQGQYRIWFHNETQVKTTQAHDAEESAVSLP